MKHRLLFAMLAVSAGGWAQRPAPVPESGNVTMQLDEYDRLVDLASRPARKPDAPPFPHVLKSADLNLQVKGESVTGAILVEGEVLARGDRQVPLVSNMIVLDAQQNGRDLPLEQQGGVHSALLTGPAEFAVTLQTAVPLTVETGRASFNLPVPAAGAARMTLSVPGDQTQVNLSPGLITSRSSRDGHTTIEATLVPGETANIWWAARLVSPPPTPKPVRFLSDVKTLVSVSEGDLTLAALAEITVVQGEPAQFEIEAPEGYELTGATGPTLVSSEVQGKTILLKVGDAAARSHQFLISLTKSNTDVKAEIPPISVRGTQRETGEVLIEGGGAIELTASERGGLRRMDFKETSPYLRSLASTTLHAAFRYQKKPSEIPAVGLEWVRFPDGRVLSAVAQQAVVTTLVTSEGRSLTEVKLTLKNKAQPFLKVELPAGASILSAEVAGEKVKPVQGADGSRVPLLRPGFRPEDSYVISFVFIHAGAPFAKKGGAELSLPKMDVPIGRIAWEVFLPQQYKVSRFTGDALTAGLFSDSPDDVGEEIVPVSANAVAGVPGQIVGMVVDSSGAAVAGAVVALTHVDTGQTWKVAANSTGNWAVSNVPTGRVRIVVSVLGFKIYTRDLSYDARQVARADVALQVGSSAESVTVTAEATLLKTESGEVRNTFTASNLTPGVFQPERNSKQNGAPVETAASANVTDFQRRVAGVLPIAVNVPRTGTSYRFIRPLVVDEETKLSFSYRSVAAR